MTRRVRLAPVATVASRLRVIGPGRAGGALVPCALRRAGWEVRRPVPAGERLSWTRPSGVDVLAITTPDGVIAEVAAAGPAEPATLVVHCSGALDARRAGPPRAASVAAPAGAPAVAGAQGADRAGGRLVRGGRRPDVGRRSSRPCAGGRSRCAEARPAPYHAAAAIASNHLVALLGQAQRVGARAGVPLEAYLDLARGVVDSVAELGPAAAITGPIQRGDWAHRRQPPRGPRPVRAAGVRGDGPPGGAPRAGPRRRVGA